MKIDRAFYLNENVIDVARSLLGKILIVRSNDNILKGMIVEVEAYSGAIDRASHAYKNKRTERTKIMFEQGGTVYVYLCYGIHHLFNIVTNQKGIADAVLIRAIQPITGINSTPKIRKGSLKLVNLANGPGKLSNAA